jgi:large subunit ribosomal protein L24
VSSGQGRSLLALLGLDRIVSAGDGPAQFEGTATGAWGAPLRLKAKISATGLDADAEGAAEPWAAEAKANLGLKVRSADFGPLLDLRPQDTLAQNIGLSSRVTLAGNKLTFDDLDSNLGGSRLRGRVAVTLGEEREIEGEIGAEQLALAPAFAVAIGAARHDAAEPLGTGLMKGWRGKVAFQALRGALPGGSELQPVSGVIKGDGQSLTFDAITGKIGGGDVTATIDARPGANGIAVNASVQLAGVDGAALRYRNLAMPAGRASLQMTLTSQGRSAQALTGALSGSGTLTLESARIAGLDPRAFEVAVRANDTGQVKDDVRLKQIVEATLPAGALAVPTAQIPFTIRDGRLRVGATPLDGNGVRATVSGGYDIAADQADIRAALSLTMTTGRPEIQLLAVGTPDALSRSVDVAPLSSWLAVRAIDHETKRLDAIERGEPPPAAPPPIVLPAEGLLPIPEAAPAPAAQKGGRDRRPPKKTAGPRPPTVNAPAPPSTGATQVPAMPPPITVRPAPGAAKPRPPLALTPQLNPPPRSN